MKLRAVNFYIVRRPCWPTLLMTLEVPQDHGHVHRAGRGMASVGPNRTRLTVLMTSMVCLLSSSTIGHDLAPSRVPGL
jgi:hypothetical protein